MVNVNRQKILEILSEGKTVSGEKMAGILGCSRVAVWKHINRLEQAGYVIHSGSEGYTLAAGSDVPIPEALGNAGDRIEYTPVTSSTMDEARTAVLAGCPAETVFVAGQQTGGRGRNSHPWHSAAGGLYFTIADRPVISPRFIWLHVIRAAVSLCRVLENRYGIRAFFKWPNDIYAENRKIAGILPEYLVQGNSVLFVNIGIGINVHNSPDLAIAGNVDRISGRSVARNDLLREFLTGFAAPQDFHALVQAADACSLLRNRKIRARTSAGELLSGIAGKIGPEGRLFVKTGRTTGSMLDFENEIIHIEGIQS
ncbi:MAG: biotin--[acetyl-CoA-carboxylase] ligase [Spirochaetales bacterium]|nr:biotin--[acetyl-CoA-carboxylase] ligase [Spirochaetales bacterium]